MSIIDDALTALKNILLFVETGSQLKLRSYQQEIALAIIDSVRFGRGLSFVVILPRQSGKNELQAHIEAYLLTIYSQVSPKDMVKVSPTWKPQSQTAMRRLERVLR